ncbi:MAG: cohesin domain-containing protein [Candidatus Kaiserbacteria bacterium]|nr:cohesin domain-containing protein [Candidatus Kaiserbacteria bacterium]
MNIVKHFSKYAVILPFFLIPLFAHAATLSLVPSSSNVPVGNTVTVSVFVNSEGVAINNAEGNLSFSKSLFDVVSINKDASLFTLWIAAPTYDGNNTISFNGGLPSPGYQGSNGKLFSVILRARAAGTATLALVNGAVRANDGLGTDVLTIVSNTSVIITQPATPATTPSPTTSTPNASSEAGLLALITSSTHSVQTNWYDHSHVVLDWTNAQGVTAVRLGYDKDAGGAPHVLYTDPISHKEIDLGDGIWYFHVQERGSDGWGSISTFRIQIDTVPPKPFAVTVVHQSDASNPQAVISFNTTDITSGIDHYTVTVADETPVTVPPDEATTPYLLSTQKTGEETVVVNAYDKAGNTTSESVVLNVMATAPPAGTTTEQQFNGGGLFTAFGTTYQAVFWYVLLALAIIIGLALIVSAGYLLWRRLSLLRHRLRHIAVRSGRGVQYDFARVMDDVHSLSSLLHKTKQSRQLTKEENIILDTLKHHLEKTEDDILSRLEQIDDEAGE